MPCINVVRVLLDLDITNYANELFLLCCSSPLMRKPPPYCEQNHRRLVCCEACRLSNILLVPSLLCLQTAWLCLGYTLTSRGARILDHMPIPHYQSDVINLEVSFCNSEVHARIMLKQLFCIPACVLRVVFCPHVHMHQVPYMQTT